MSTNGHDDDRLAEEAMAQLRAANPAEAGSFDAKGSAMYEKITSGETANAPKPAWQRLPVMGGAAAAVGALALAGVLMMSGGGSGSTTASPDGEPTLDPGGGGLASCLAYSVEELRAREFAFLGTVTNIDGGMVTFAINEAYHGAAGDTMTLEADSTLQNSMYTEFQFEVGEQYLVSGDAEFAWGCGYTRPFDGELAAEWEAAFAGGPANVNASQAVGSDGAASCAFFFEDATLLQRDRAFDGVVVGIEEGVQGPGGIPYAQVTFEVNEWFKGEGSATIDLLASGLAYGDRTSEEPTLQLGERYLVSGDAEFAWGCGFTRTHSDAEADNWRALFGE